MAKAASTATKRQTLVVVESPTKAKTMKKYLGSGYEVLASKGHIKDLPKKMGIDIEHGFQETYEVIEGKAKVLDEIKASAKDADEILLATDPDREGEAIAVHIAQELKSLKKSVHRVLFHEITPRGIKEGIDHPQELNDNLYEAQRTRRVLDRLVGYDVSALVWSKVAFGLSAGRVQSVALRLIVDREKEIEAFVPEEYWNIGVALSGTQKMTFLGRLVGWNGQKDEVHDGDTAAKVKADLAGATYRVKAVTKSEKKRHAPAPFTTSKLQQDATSQLRFTAKRTMQIAQSLYEGVDLGKDGGPVGLITYMRTDSTRVSPDAVQAVREHIVAKFGKDAIPAEPNTFKSKKNAQEAHEAIRPTSLELSPDSIKKHLKEEQYKLYKLVYDRFIASQMISAVYDQTSVDIEAKVAGKAQLAPTYDLRASGRVLKVPGWLEVYGKGLKEELAGEEDEKEPESKKPGEVSLESLGDSAELPPLAEGEALSKVDPPGVLADQKFTQPPARYNEGSLVRELEKRGIGRPSTYAEIISKVQARDYVEKLPSGGFKPTELGRIVVDGLVASALDFMDPGFTAQMEEELDEVEQGKKKRVELLKSFYKRFKEQLDRSKKGKRWNPEPIDTGVECESCHEGTMHKRWSKNGWFLGCSNYPKCKNTKNLGADGQEAAPARETIFECEKCHAGKLVMKHGRYGDFLGCSNYPKCDFTRPVPMGIKCPKCKTGDLIEIKPKKRGGRTFWGCSNFASTPSCDFKVWQRPVREPCPKCAAPFLVIGGKKKEPELTCVAEGCGYKRPVTPEEATALSTMGPPEDIFAEPKTASEDEDVGPRLPREPRPSQQIGAELPAFFPAFRLHAHSPPGMTDPIVVLGVSRSGTTLVRVLLGSHSAIAAPPETPWITGAYGDVSIRDFVQRLAKDRVGPLGNLSGVDEDDLFRAARAFALSILGAYAERRGKTIVAIKTPKDVRHLDVLARIFPKARYVHVIRDGRDVACSTVRRRQMVGLDEWGEVTVANAMRRWRDWEDRIRAAEASGAIDVIATVRYERLVVEPEAVLRDVCAAIGVPFEPAMLAWDPSKHDLPAWEAGSTDVREHAAIDRASVGRWRRELSAEERESIDRDFGDDLVRLGYARAADEC